MSTRRARTLLVMAGAGALGATALALSVTNAVTMADAGTAGANDDAPLAEPDFPICRTPVAHGAPSLMLRFAQTEVPRAPMSAATSAAAFADTEPPLWPGLG